MKTCLRRWVPCVFAASWMVAVLLGLSSCTSSSPRAVVFAAPQPDKPFAATTNAFPDDFFVTEVKAPSKQYAAPAAVSNFSESAVSAYHLGPGDKFSFMVRGRSDVSLPSVTVSPDGFVALPVAGILQVSGKTLDDVTAMVRKKFEVNYEKPDVTLVMLEYNNNAVFVLGRVAHPGAVHFSGQGTLLEALSLAGGLPTDTQKSSLSRCMIVRGRTLALWIDLAELLENGNMALNAKLQNGDFIFIPQNDDQLVNVMGEVNVPGVVLLRSQMSLLDVISHAGGMTKDANTEHVFLVRAQGGKGLVQDIDVSEIIQRGDMRENFVLRDGDIVFVSARGISRFNYYMTQLLPAMKVIDFTLTAGERLGAMQELRSRVWGQSGIVNGTSN